MALTAAKNNAVNDTAATSQNKSITINVLANDGPPGTPKSLVSLSGTSSTTSNLGAKIRIVNGQVSYDPTSDPFFIALAAGQTAVDTFNYTMSEPGGKLYTATVSVTVSGLNDPPIINGVTNQKTTDTTPINVFSGVTVTDPDNGAQETMTINTFDSNKNLTDANGTLSGSGLVKTGVGTYSLATTSPAFLNSELAGLQFTPTPHQAAAGSTVNTSFTMSVTDGAASDTKSMTLATTESAGGGGSGGTIVGYGDTIITIPNAGSSLIQATPNGINNSGEIVGSYDLGIFNTGVLSIQTHGFTDINGIVRNYDVPGATSTIITRVNSNGDIAGIYETGGNSVTHPFVIANGVFQNIPINNIGGLVVNGLNDHGQVTIVDSGDGVSWLYDDTTATLTQLTINGSPVGIFADGINNQGMIFGGYDKLQDPVTHGLLMDTHNNNAFTQFDVPNQPAGQSTIIKAMNDNGDIAGDSITKPGQFVTSQAFLSIGADLNNTQLITGLDNVEGMNINDFLVGDGGHVQMGVYGGISTLNQVLDIDPYPVTGNAIGINDQNEVIGTLVGPQFGTASGSITTHAAMYGTPIFGS